MNDTTDMLHDIVKLYGKMFDTMLEIQNSQLKIVLILDGIETRLNKHEERLSALEKHQS